jgi:uncharacterized OsmC-like protein
MSERLGESWKEEGPRISRAFERNARALELRPSVGRGTAVTRVRARRGLTCEIEEGPWKLTADMSEKSGGHNTGPNPGVLGRAALGSCLVIGYVLWASKRGVPLDHLEVEVQADYDSRREHGIGDDPPGYSQVRILVTVESDAPDEDVRRVLEEAEAASSWLDIFRRPVDIKREVQFVREKGA